jgi:hypothetical protein
MLDVSSGSSNLAQNRARSLIRINGAREQARSFANVVPDGRPDHGTRRMERGGSASGYTDRPGRLLAQAHPVLPGKPDFLGTTRAYKAREQRGQGRSGERKFRPHADDAAVRSPYEKNHGERATYTATYTVGWVDCGK